MSSFHAKRNSRLRTFVRPWAGPALVILGGFLVYGLVRGSLLVKIILGTIVLAVYWRALG